jgi:O-antigen/teichoic acid export membrane protein
MDQRRRRLRRIGKAGAAVTIAAAFGNALSYVVPVLGARQLDAANFSELATVMSICAIASVPGLGLQTAVAVGRARSGTAASIAVSRLTIGTAVGTGVVLLAVSPLLQSALDLPTLATPLAAAITVPVVAAGRYLGELQGALRFVRLAAAMLLLAIARTTGVIIGLAAGAGLIGSLVAGAAVAWLALVGIAVVTPRPGTVIPAPGRQLIRDLIVASNATLAMFLISNADLIAARYLLTPVQSGGYAVLSVLTKGALWAPQVITVLALPRFARGVRRTRSIAALAVVIGGGILVGLAAVAGRLAVRLVGGPDYVHLARYAPVFAATGALYALVFVLVNAQVASGRAAPSAPIWVAIIGFGAAVLTMPDPTISSVIGIALATAAATAAVVMVVTLWQRHSARAAESEISAGRRVLLDQSAP